MMLGLLLMTMPSVIQAYLQKKNLLLLEVSINEKKQPGIFTCYAEDEHIYVREKDLQNWNFPPIHRVPVVHAGEKYFSLNWYPFVKYHLDKSTLELFIIVPANYFPSSQINLSQYNPCPVRPAFPGLFLNYDFTSIDNTHAAQLSNSALLDLGYFNHFGVGTNDVLVSNYNALDPSGIGTYHFVRLNTTWTLDQPEKIATWRFGDAITGASTWSGSARFGGIQYATNFNTQPNFITFPLPGFRGEAIVPTNLQIFVNGVLNQQKSIENGIYNVTNIPVVTGAGTVNVVTQDLLGRTQSISFPYYASPNLLKEGLSDYSYEMGFLRENYGIDSNNYQDLLATATLQYGLTNSLTLGTHAELLSSQQTLGISSDYLIDKLGVMSLATAKSHSQFGGGTLLSAGFSRQTPVLSIGFKTTYMSSDYQQIGMQVGESGPLGAVTTQQYFLGYDAGILGSFGLSYTYTKQLAIPDAVSNPGPQISEISTLSYSRGVFKNTTFTLSAIADLHNSDNNQFYAAIIISLDNLHTVSAYTNTQQHQTQPALLYSRNLPLGVGYGYHVLATTNGINGPGGDFTWQNEIGTYTAKAYHIANKNYYEGDINGAVIYFGGHPFLSRQLLQSFALVQVPGYENIRVYYQNQLAGRTDRYGNVLIPQILPYQENTLSIESRDLPFNADIGETSVKVFPYYLSGTIARFDVQKTFNLKFHLVQRNGDYVPAGAEILLDNNEKYLVGYEGTVFITAPFLSVLKGKGLWNHHACHFAIKRPLNDMDGLKERKVSCL